MSPMKDDRINSLKSIIDSAKEILCVGHIHPDGDAIGASLGLGLALKKAGKDVKVTWGSEIFIPSQYRFLPGLELIKNPEDIGTPDCILVLDCASRSRLGELQEYIEKSECVVNIDHHQSNDMFGTLNIVNPETSSTSELLYQIINGMGIEIDGDVLQCLYTGIVTDSGRFQYTNTTAATHEIAADMIRRGIEPNYIFRRVFERSTLGSLKLLSLMLERAVFDPDLSLIYSWISLADMDSTGTNIAETENFVDYLRAVGEPLVAAMIKQDEPGNIKVSLRSKEDYDVSELAGAFAGGGHKQAAGYTSLKTSIEAVITELKTRMEQDRG